MNVYYATSLVLIIVLSVSLAPSNSIAAADRVKEVENRDAAYLDAIKQHAAQRIKDIATDTFTLVTGDGKTYSRNGLLARARDKSLVYDQFGASDKKVYKLADRTFVVTALLSIKGKNSVNGTSFECKLWYSNVYVKLGEWRLAFSQSSQPQSGDCPYP